eukprot:10567153-Prorocentrum_lima.AAC.1
MSARPDRGDASACRQLVLQQPSCDPRRLLQRLLGDPDGFVRPQSNAVCRCQSADLVGDGLHEAL